MITKADEIKFLVMCYWRFARSHYFVATEYDYGDADVISMSPGNNVVCETEVKISIADLKKEKRKRKHFKDQFGNRVFHAKYINYFYFAMPEELTQLDQVRLICDGAFPYAGILAVKPYEDFLSDPRGVFGKPPVECVKQPTSCKPYALNSDRYLQIARGMSNSFCRLGFEVMRMKRGF